ncbi:radical SAM protein [Candidatus Pacearchaeota archaeon]|nr:radical SAM protein [Candidatus Pacearchaeota archaeon]
MNNLHASIIITYRCNAKCNMCDVFHYPTKPDTEITASDLECLPRLHFANITGGEPFIRKDLEDIIEVVRRKADRIVISSNGYFTDRTIALFKKYPDLGIRISIEGLPKSNDTIRGIKDGFDKGLRTLMILREMGIKDVGFGMTVQDINAKDLCHLYDLSDALGYEFATATLHNSHYFHKKDNKVEDVPMVETEFKKLVRKLLKSNSPKKWFRAYFNHGLINYLHKKKRLLPCEMGSENFGFFIDPTGNVLPCNGMDEPMSFGNIKDQPLLDILGSDKAKQVQECVAKCDKQCWMIGSVAPAIKKNIKVPALWILKNKIRLLMGKEPC